MLLFGTKIGTHRGEVNHDQARQAVLPGRSSTYRFSDSRRSRRSLILEDESATQFRRTCISGTEKLEAGSGRRKEKTRAATS
jgi:hypothetical protein